jgi:hypothetical protein
MDKKPSSFVPTMKIEYLAIRCIATTIKEMIKVREDPAMAHF